MTSEPQNVDAVIVGAGAIGSACALGLAKARPDLSFALIERAAPLQTDLGLNQRVWALGHAAADLLTELGVMTNFPAEASHAYTKMVVWDENSDGELCFNAADFAQEMLGHMVDADQCTAALQDQLWHQSNLMVRFSCQITAAEQLEVRPQLEIDSAEGVELLNTELIIAADGVRSSLRNLIGIFAPAQSYQQRGVVAKIRSELSHQDTAWQRFLSTGPIAVLPLADNYSSIVWSTSEVEATSLLECDAAEFEARLSDALAKRFGQIELSGERASFPLQSRQAERYFKGRVALIGDAAHSIHPLAGQGANLGFKDVRALIDVLANSQDLGAADGLVKYQRIRRPDNLQTDFMMSALHHSYRINTPLWSMLRGRGMNWLSQSELLKSWLGRQAMGL